MTDRSDPPPSSPRRRLRSARPVALLVVALALGLGGGCAPGSGGTGYPDSSVQPPTAGTPPSAPPPSAPPPSSGEPPSVPPPAPPSASLCANPSQPDSAGTPEAQADATAPYQGTIRALESDCLLVGDRWIAVDQAVIVTRAGLAADRSALAAGRLVTIEPDVADPRRAARIVIEPEAESGS